MQQGNILQSQFTRGGHCARADIAECEHSVCVCVCVSLSFSTSFSHTTSALWLFYIVLATKFTTDTDYRADF